MLQFCKRLASKGVRVTLITTSSTPEFTQTQSSSIIVERISDGFKEGEITQENVEKLFGQFISNLSQSLADLIDKQTGSKYPPKFLVYDAAMPWALDVARRCGIDGAPLCTTNMAVHAIYYLVRQGQLKHPLEGLPSMLLPGISDLQNESPDEARLNEILNQFSNIHRLNFLFVNTFDKLEDEVVKWMERQLPVKTIGPTIPSMYLDKRLEDDKGYGLSLFKPNTEACINWLDSKETASVVYVSFGSWCGLGEEQMEEIAWGLKRSNSYFLWVVKESEEKKLPNNFIEETSQKGLVVSWSPQLEVLAHKSVGCFMTHCGWNSTLEALSLGVPLVAMPQYSEQKMNAKFIADVWEIGVRVRVNEKGIVTKEEIEKCVRQIMEGERGQQIKGNSQKFKKLAKEAVDDGGSSDKNIHEFVAKLAST
ncbi:hypothetical protein JRO89_XS03G0034600 [Xanthoceras sorbifolium]|uniref:Glycosyltransferase n=1 Tax=Xanthoceras sorbifolium TaxID=99658 RepID=A0ABQ8I8H7_9ROSI|nr:hypothetical protein JRO89_XS03G0034600 [Xanthoceras sorbifolium]